MSNNSIKGAKDLERKERKKIMKEAEKLLKGGLLSGDDDALQVLMSTLRALGPAEEES